MADNHDIEISFTGDVFSLFFRLEGREVDLRFDGEGNWERRLPAFAVHGPLDFYALAKGFSQTRCTLRIGVDGQAPITFEEEIPGAGFLELKGEITL
jgi:hypothetical protein